MWRLHGARPATRALRYTKKTSSNTGIASHGSYTASYGGTDMSAYDDLLDGRDRALRLRGVIWRLHTASEDDLLEGRDRALRRLVVVRDERRARARGGAVVVRVEAREQRDSYS